MRSCASCFFAAEPNVKGRRENYTNKKIQDSVDAHARQAECPSRSALQAGPWQIRTTVHGTFCCLGFSASLTEMRFLFLKGSRRRYVRTL